MISTYSDLTIGQYIKCKAITNIESDPVQRKLKMLSIITGQSVDELESLPIAELIKRLKAITEVESLGKNAKVKMKFKVKGRRFECIWKSQELRADQYIDATFYTKGDIEQNIHNILAAICVERTWYGKKLPYSGDKHKEISELFLNEMKISTAYPIMLFFSKYLRELERNTAIYLEKEMEKVADLLKNGDGLQPSTE